jgi:hypothetical protein
MPGGEGLAGLVAMGTEVTNATILTWKQGLRGEIANIKANLEMSGHVDLLGSPGNVVTITR